MADLPAASPQYRLTREAAPMLKRSASHAFVTLVLCLATDANAIFSALPFGCFGKSAADISRALSPIAINLSAFCSFKGGRPRFIDLTFTSRREHAGVEGCRDRFALNTYGHLTMG